MPAGHLVLHDAEERFHYAVADAVALPGHGLDYPLLLEPFPAEVVPVLPAHVAMEDEALEVLVLREGGIEHAHRPLEARRHREAPRHDAAGSRVDDRGKAAFPERAGELRGVRRPLLVRAVGLEVPRDHVLRDAPGLADAGFVLPLPRYRGKAHLGHQAPDLLMVGDDPSVPELGDDPPEAVPSLVGREYFPDFGHDIDVLGIFP